MMVRKIKKERMKTIPDYKYDCHVKFYVGTHINFNSDITNIILNMLNEPHSEACMNAQIKNKCYYCNSDRCTKCFRCPTGSVEALIKITTKFNDEMYTHVLGCKNIDRFYNPECELCVQYKKEVNDKLFEATINANRLN